MPHPFFSIVIANRNFGRYLEEAIRSVLNQSCQDFELIVVDGGSDDDSVEIIRKYQGRIAWWCSETDRGQSHAFNKGFARATGRWFLWLNADDLLLPNCLLRAKICIERKPQCQWVAGNTIFFSADQRVLWCSRGPFWIRALITKLPPYVHGPSSFFSRDSFLKAGGFDESLRYAMDVDLWGKFSKAGMPFVRLNHYCWGFRVHDLGKTSHAFGNAPSAELRKESELLLDRYHWNRADFYYKVLFLVKLFLGYYLKSWIDTKRFGAKHMTEIAKYLQEI